MRNSLSTVAHCARLRVIATMAAAALGLLVISIGASAQTGAAMSAPGDNWNQPRTPDGQPNLQGVWGRSGLISYDIEAPPPQEAYPGRDLQTLFTRSIVDPPDGKIPYQAWAREMRERLHRTALYPQTLAELDPQARCVPGGQPRMAYQGAFQILQPPGYVLFLYEWAHQYRVIPLDNRPHPTDKIKLFTGDSRGHWEGNTLVVEITNYNDSNWLDVVGDFHSDAFRVVERWTRVAPNALRYEATIDDPKVYTRPWKMVLTERPITGDAGEPYTILEEACHEGNRALRRLIPWPEDKDAR